MSDRKTKKIILKQLEYPSKVLIAWREAIGGNVEIRDFLIRSPYKELGIFCFAIFTSFCFCSLRCYMLKPVRISST